MVRMMIAYHSLLVRANNLVHPLFPNSPTTKVIPKTRLFSPMQMQMQPYSFSTIKTYVNQSSYINDVPTAAIKTDQVQVNSSARVELRPELMPKHVGAILDGNRRWAQAHGKELDYGPFCQGYLHLADLCIKWGVSVLSCFLFSTENWKRPKDANDLLFQQLQQHLEEGVENFTRKGIKVTIIGDKPKLPTYLQEVIKQVEEKTKKNSVLELNFAVSYGGKWDVVEAIRKISRKAKAGEMKLEDINECVMSEHLSTHGLQYPDPDLMIRTGGNQRVSNFLVWQMSHTEFYFTDVYGPDFTEDHFIDALRWFQQCDRKFGK